MRERAVQTYTHHTEESIDHEWSRIWFGSQFGDPPVLVASIQTFNGGDPAGVRLNDWEWWGCDVKVEEEDSDGSGVAHDNADAIGLVAVEEGFLRDTSGNLVGEAHTHRVEQSGSSDWETIDLLESYDRPVVFAQVLTYNGSEPCHTRVKNVGSSSFDLQIEEWEYLDEKHNPETVGYVVLEEGRHQLDNGLVVEVATTEVDLDVRDRWHSVDPPDEWGIETRVITHCQTYNGGDAVVTRQRPSVPTGPNDSWGFDVRLQEQETNRQEHTQETVGYLLAGAELRTDTGMTAESVTDRWSTIWYDTDFADPPVTLASIETYNGGDPAGVRMNNWHRVGFDVMIEEEASDGSPNYHPNAEIVGYFAVEEGAIEDTEGNDVGAAGVIRQGAGSRLHGQAGVDVERFDEPVVFAQVMTYNGPDPCHTRLEWRNDGTEVYPQIEEWEYLNGDHYEEAIGYVVLEAGTYQLDDGMLVDVGTVTTDDDWSNPVTFTSDINPYPEADRNPAVITQCQTKNGTDPVVTRQKRDFSRGADSFSVRLQEEKVQDGSREHYDEEIGYLVAGDPLRVDVGRTDQSMDHDWSPVKFRFGNGPNFADPPVTLASMQTYNGSDPAGVRMRNLSRSGFEVMIEEEQSDGSGTVHGNAEVVGYFAVDRGPIRDTEGNLVGEADTMEFGMGSRRDPGKTREFNEDFDYSEIEVFGQIMTYNGSDPCHLRPLGWLGTPTDALYAKIEEWNYLNGKHDKETVGYVALEDGVHQLDDGTVVEVGRRWVDDEWESVDISADVNADPTVITQPESVMDDTPAVTRHRNVTRDSFEVRFQEEKAEDDDHDEEPIAYLVVG